MEKPKTVEELIEEFYRTIVIWGPDNRQVFREFAAAIIKASKEESAEKK